MFKSFKSLIGILLLFAAVEVVSADSLLNILPESNNRVFTPEEEIALQLNRSLSGTDGKFNIDIIDFYGQVVFHFDGQWQKDRQAVEIPVRLARSGYFTVKVAWLDANGKNRELKQDIAVIPPPPATDNEQNRFGVNFHLTRIPLGDAEREITMARRIGFGWGRGMLFDWSDLKEKPDYASPKCFARWDELVELVKRSGLSCLGGIYFVPKWASGAPVGSDYITYSRIIPADLSQATAFGEAFAKHCSFVKYWEVGNESDAELFWRGRWESNNAGDDKKIIEDYVDFLKASRAGFRAGNPQSKILFTGVTGGPKDGNTYKPFIATAFKADAGKFIDIMNIHYRKSTPAVRQWMGKGNDHPVWVTESGGSAVGSDRDRQQIIDDITQAVVQIAEGAEKIFKYDFRNDGTSPTDKEHNFGLVRKDFSPKPAYAAYATLIRMLDNTQFCRQLNVTGNSADGWLQGYEFAQAGQSISCFWLNNAKKSKITLDTPAQEVKKVDIWGNVQALIAVNKSIVFEADNLPFFIIGGIKDHPGAIKIPGDELVRKISIPLKNPGFEAFAGNFPGWNSTFDSSCSISRSQSPHAGNGAVAVTIPAPGQADFRSVFQRIDIKKYCPPVKTGEGGGGG